MKHIKHYEHKKKYTPEQFSDYITWLSSDTKIIILKNEHKIEFYLKDKNQPLLRVTQIYSYNILNNSIIENSNSKITGLFLDPDTIQNRILYQSNDMQDCIDMIHLISSANKYNL